MVGFIFGGNTGLDYDELQEKRRRADLLSAQILGRKPQTALEGWGTLLGSIGGSIARGQADKGMKEGRQQASSMFDSIMSKMTGQPATGTGANLPMPGAAAEVAATTPTKYAAEGSTFNPFMGAVKAGGLTNPYALAAVAATGDAESGWSAANANRTWSDPSESGKPGRAGGVMSWRGPRYDALAAKGDLSATGQANFFLQENPQLIQQLQGAKSVEEAQQLMNNAWAFAGYDRPGGESARRLSLAKGYLPQFQGGNQVASLDPSAGMSGAAAIERQAPGSGYVDPAVSAPNAQPVQAPIPQSRPEQPFDMSRFGPEQPQRGGRLPMPDQSQQAPQQLSVAPQAQQMPAPVSPPAPQRAPQNMVAQASPLGGIDPQMISLMNNPFLPAEQREVLKMIVQQQMQQADPMRQMQMQKLQQDLAEGQNGTWAKLDDGRLYNQRTGEIRNAPAAPGAAPSDLGLNPQYGVDDAGNPVLLQLGKNGQVVKSQMPSGVTLSKEPIRLDAGTHFVLLDPITRQPVGQIPKDKQGEADQTATGKANAEARSAFPQVEAAATQMLGSIDSLRDDPYLDNMVGSVQGRWLPNVTSDAARVQSKMDQIGGQSFLQAFNSLRGAGQITEQEGAKATAAMGRLNTAQSESDYRDALQELHSVVEGALERARRSAGGQQTAPAAAPRTGPVSIGGYTIEAE